MASRAAEHPAASTWVSADRQPAWLYASCGMKTCAPIDNRLQLMGASHTGLDTLWFCSVPLCTGPDQRSSSHHACEGHFCQRKICDVSTSSTLYTCEP